MLEGPGGSQRLCYPFPKRLLGNPLCSHAPTRDIPRSCHSSPHLWASPTCSHLPAGGEGKPGGFEIPDSRPGESSPELQPSTHGALTGLGVWGHQRHPNIVHFPLRGGHSEGDTAPGSGEPPALNQAGLISQMEQPLPAQGLGTRTQLFVRKTKTTHAEPPLWLRAGGAGGAQPHLCPQEGTQARPRCEEMLQVTRPQSRTHTPKRHPEPSEGSG